MSDQLEPGDNKDEPPYLSPDASEATTTPSIGLNATVRLGGDAAILLFGVLSATLSARALGPADKGTLSTLLYVQMLLSYTGSLGMADAVIILVGKGRSTRQEMLSTLLPLLTLSGLIAGMLLIIFGFVVDWSAIRTAVLLAAFLVPLVILTHVFSGLENAMERIATTTLVSVVTAAVTALGLWIMLVVLDMGIAGGVLAGMSGSAIGLLLLTRSLRKQGLSFRLARKRNLAVDLLRLGVAAQVGTTLVALSQRADLVVVYGLAGEAAAGRYTVALTLSQLAFYAPLALVSSSFPRLARIPDVEVPYLYARLSRIGLAAAFISSAFLGALIPVIVRVLFGDPFAGSITPALILLPGAVLWSEQWLLSRVALARGRTDLYLRSFASSLVVMLVGDILLIPVAGIIGAAVASVVAAAVGILVVVRPILGGDGIRWHNLLPRATDFRQLAHEIRFIARSPRKQSRR